MRIRNSRRKSFSKKSQRRTYLFTNGFLICFFLVLVSFFVFRDALPDDGTVSEQSSEISFEKPSIQVSPTLVSKDFYLADDFGIVTVKSPVDFNQNGIDDYTDFLLGAKQEARRRPVYNESYWEGGYPPDGLGVCTDVVWRAFAHAGYDFKQMIDNDIERYRNDYVLLYDIADPNIDFRRVPNLRVFFEKYAIELTIDPYDISSWQPGDFVFYGDRHVAVVSDLRNQSGVSWIIHNSDDHDEYEEDYLIMDDLNGHFRFDASKVSEDVLVDWGDS